MDPRPPEDDPTGPGGSGEESADDALRRLEDRLGRASEAAERLIAEAAGTVGRAAESFGRAGGPPPAGWQVPGAAGQAGGGKGDVELLSQVLGSLRELIPPELQRRLADALRELLMAIRALIDWYLERTERKRAEPSEVQDIPIL
jgi:hypothetical protein